MAGNKGLGLLLAGGAALVLMGGKKKNRSKSSGSSSSPTSPAYTPAGSDVIPETPPPAPKPKKDGKKVDPFPVDKSASDSILNDYASNPAGFESAHNVFSGDAIADYIYKTAQTGCPSKLNQNDPRHSLCIKEWKRIRSKVEKIADSPAPSPGAGSMIHPNIPSSNEWLNLFAANQEAFGENYGLGKYASGDDVTDFIYRRAQPHCPPDLDQNNPSHEMCIKEWLRIRDEVFRIIQESD